MIVLMALSAMGLLIGFLLMTRVPLCTCDGHNGISSDIMGRGDVAIIIPARNEEQNLPRLLASLPPLAELAEIIVVDDDSTDRTAEIARSFHARVVTPGEPPAGFTGKAWACAQGAKATSADALFFLDADTFFAPAGAAALLRTFASAPTATALSVLPFAITQEPFEELSLFFNLMMAFGAGGFGVLRAPRLFGQSLLLSRTLYQEAGGHISVGSFVLENVHLSRHIKASSGQCVCLGGRGTLHMRMFPAGLRQLCNGWTKAFADGAQSTDPRILVLSVLWLSALTGAALALVLAPPHLRSEAALLYLLAAAQTMFFARQVGTFRGSTCLFFPIPLIFFFVLFTRSAIRRATHRRTDWRGRSV